MVRPSNLSGKSGTTISTSLTSILNLLMRAPHHIPAKIIAASDTPIMLRGRHCLLLHIFGKKDMMSNSAAINLAVEKERKMNPAHIMNLTFASVCPLDMVWNPRNRSI